MNKSNIDKKISYLNYTIIALSLIPALISTYNFISANLEIVKNTYQFIPLILSSYFIGVTLISTKITGHLKNIIIKNKTSEEVQIINQNKITNDLDYQKNISNKDTSYKEFSNHWKTLTEEEKKNYVINNLQLEENNPKIETKSKTYTKKL